MWGYIALAGFEIWQGLATADLIRGSAEFNERVAELNAEFIEIDAYEAEVQGISESARYQTIIDGTIGTQKVAFAAQDVDITFGTAAEIQAENRLTGFLNRLDLEAAGRNKALGLKIEASNVRLGSSLQTMQSALEASSAELRGFLGAARVGVAGAGRAGFFDSEVETKTGVTGVSGVARS